jgi:hypothetical protein
LRTCFLALISIAVWSLPAFAQEASVAPGPRLVAAFTESTRLESSRAPLSRGTKWALGGGIVVGVLSAATANALCERHDGCTGPTLTWGVIGAGVGAVLGALNPRPRACEPPERSDGQRPSA